MVNKISKKNLKRHSRKMIKKVKGGNTRKHKKIVLPDFLIMGTQKGGTTEISDKLFNHPSLCLKPIIVKDSTSATQMEIGNSESHFYNNDELYTSTKELEKYCDELQKLKKKKEKETGHKVLVGDKTPMYMYLPKCIHRIKETYDKYGDGLPKMIISLRNPITRAESHYRMIKTEAVYSNTKMRRDSFIDEIKHRLSTNKQESIPKYAFLDRGLYYKQIKNIQDTLNLPLEQFISTVCVVFMEHNAEDNLNKIYDFLGVDRIPYKKGNLIKPRSKSLHELGEESISPSLHKELVEFFKEDVEQLSTMYDVPWKEWK